MKCICSALALWVWSTLSSQLLSVAAEFMVSRGGEVLKVDATFRDAKHIHVDNKKVIPSITTVMNEYVQPIQQWPGSKSWTGLSPRLLEMMETYK
mmetsp:Transcript_26700/g.58137  ORF Transcript_26700/g.58137 Transcript_26700/m.58137 type:complete len:95 (-) Transcript_26700:931-1215(-)